MILLARLISILASPIIVTAPVSYALVLKTSGDPAYSLFWMLSSLLFAGVVGVFVLYGVKRGMFSNFDISIREERKPLFVFAAIVSLVYFVVIFLLHGPKILMASLGALLLGVFIDSIVNRKIKASVHLAVFSAFATVLGILYGGVFWLLILLIPLVAWSRIKLKRHTLPETIVGTAIGVFLVAALYCIVNYLLIIK